jgi:anti-anti-sigma regulatory factor
MTTLTPPQMTISLASEFGTVLVGRGAAASIRERIERAAREGDAPVILDFSSVLTISPSFADELFAKLPPALRTSDQIRLDGMTPALESIQRYVVAGRDQA